MGNNANTNTYRKSYNLKYYLRLIHVDVTEFESSQNCTSLRISVIRELKNLQCLAVLTNLCRGNLMHTPMGYYLGLIVLLSTNQN